VLKPEKEKPAKQLSRTQTRHAAVRRVRSEAADEKAKTVAKNPRADNVAVKRKAAKESLTFPEPLTGDAIHAWRLALGETQAKFAARINVTGSTVSQWEKKGEAEIGMFPNTLALLRKAWKKNSRK